MSRQTESGMRLRSRIQQPLRYEDEDVHFRKPYEKRNCTKPPFPDLLEEKTVPFNPNHPPAAFPSLPLSTPQIQQQAEPAPNEARNNPLPPFPGKYSFMDVSRLAKRSILDNGVDFTMSNNLAAGDVQGVDPFNDSFQPMLDETVKWDSLELAYQYRIFFALCKATKDENAASWLRLTEDQFGDIKAAVTWRQGFPVTLTQYHDGQNTLASCMDPDLLMRYADLMVRVSHYELGSPLQLLRAGIFLQQLDLPLDLLGTWVSDPLGSGQLVDATPLATRFPAMELSAEQLQDLCLQAARGLEPTLQKKKKPTVPAVSRRNVTKPKPHRPVDRPKKQSPVSLEDRSRPSTPPPQTTPADEAVAAAPTQQAQSKETSEVTSESSEDYITVLSRWTQPISQSAPNPPTSAAPQLVHETPARTPAPAISHNTDTQSVHAPTGSSSEDRSSGSMSLRRRSNLRETEAMSALRKDQDFWADSRLASSPSRSATEPPETPPPERSPAVSDVQAKAPRLKLRVSNTGFASVVKDIDQIPPPARGGKSMSNFATFQILTQPGSSAAHATDLHPVIPLLSTPDSQSRVINEPARAEEHFKQTTRSIHMPTSSPTRFGDSSDFETKLIMSPASRPRTPDFEDLGVFDAVDEHLANQSATYEQVGPMKEHSIREGVPRSPGSTNEIAMQLSPLLSKAVPILDDVVPSIEEDVEMLDAPILLEVNTGNGSTAAAIVPEESAVRGRGLDADIRKSPPRPRSISPISDNEEFEEYHQWLRGERKHGPVPRNQKLDAHQKGTESIAAVHHTANEHHVYQPATSPAEQHYATPSNQTIATPEPQSLKIKLKVHVTNEELHLNSVLRNSGARIDFQDPGEDGGGDYEESKLQKQKQKSTPKQPVAPTKVSPKTFNSAKATKLRSSVEKPTVRKAPPALTARRTTRAQSLALSEMSESSIGEDCEPSSKTSKSISGIEVLIPQTSPSAAAQKQPKEAGPRRSARLSSVDITDDSDVSHTQTRKRKKSDAPLRAKPTPDSRLRRSSTPLANNLHREIRHRTAVQSLLEEDSVMIQDSASETESEVAGVGTPPTKPKKKWTHKEYKKTRESSRLADAGVPNMKV